MEIKFNSTILLRRDNDYNYNLTKDTFIPGKGELCFVDVASQGLKLKVGDGVSTWAELDYYGFMTDDIILQGYLYNDNFYKDTAHTEVYARAINRVYIERSLSKIYYFDGNHYVAAEGEIPVATDHTAGIMKLYSTTGTNTDGTMTQKAITDCLDNKVEVDVDEQNEIIIFN